jgi:GntR family transcriptional regulator, arabinose operon transcriptional repressor
MNTGTNKSKCFYKEIKEYLLHIIGKSKSGNSLPSQTVLSNKFGVNHMTVRRALLELKEEGFIDIIKGKGSYVKQRNRDARKFHFLVVSPSVWEGSWYTLPLMNSIMEEAWQRNISISIVPRLTSSYTILDMLEKQRFAGIIWTKPEKRDFSLMYELYLKGYPVMGLNRIIPNSYCNYLSTDHVKGAYEMTSYLLKKGHRHIGIVGIGEWSPLKERYEGFKTALEENKEGVEDSFVVEVNLDAKHVEMSEELASRLSTALEQYEPTALFVTGGAFIETVISVVESKGLNIPDDLEIATYDEVPEKFPESLFIHEVIQPVNKLGKEAVKELESLARGKKGRVQVVFPPVLREKKNKRLIATESV